MTTSKVSRDEYVRALRPCSLGGNGDIRRFILLVQLLQKIQEMKFH
jgi:hypothetical protein